jgi:type IV secretion system protein TrbI
MEHTTSQPASLSNRRGAEAPLEARVAPRKGSGLRKQTVYIAGLLAAVIVLGGLSIAAQRQRNAPSPTIQTPMIFGKPDMAQTTPMARLPGSYSGLGSQPETGQAKPLPPDVAPTTQEGDTAELQRLRLALAQSELDRQNAQQDRALAEYEAAMKSPLLFKNLRTAQAIAAEAAVGDPDPAQSPPHSPGSMLLPSSGRAGVAQDAKTRFLSEAASVEPYLRKPLIDVQSAYEVKAGGFIPAALITAINSDLPGEVIAQVSQNVYDTVSGHHLLIPQGTRVLGKYQSLVSNGQNRALIVWTRLVMPNGNSIVLDGMPGVDLGGAAGAEDEVDYHLDKLAAAAALSTAIAYGGNLAREGGRDRDELDVVGETIAQESSKIGGRIIDRQLDVQPTIKIRQGHPINVLVNKDLILQPYVEN